MIYSAKEWQKYRNTAFCKNVEKEGIRLEKKKKKLYTTEYQQVLVTHCFSASLELFISAMQIGYTLLLGMLTHIVIRDQNKTVTLQCNAFSTSKF